MFENLFILRSFFNLTQEELAKEVNLTNETIILYETGKQIPSLASLKKLSTFFNITFDYLILNKFCLYPKNLKLLKLAKQLDNFSQSQERSNIEATAKSFLGENIKKDNKIKQDLSTIELTDKFNLNLKEIRKSQEKTQIEIANLINVSRVTYAQYELKNYPSVENLIKLSDFFNISIHALITGHKLSFDFNDKYFGDTMLLADHYLSLEQQKILISIMESFVGNTTSQPAKS